MRRTKFICIVLLLLALTVLRSRWPPLLRILLPPLVRDDEELGC